MAKRKLIRCSSIRTGVLALWLCLIFVPCTGKSPQPHTLKTVVRLQVRKAHLDLLALVTGFGELRCVHQGARRIPCVLMYVARDLSERHVRSALGLERAWAAVAGAGAIKNGPAIVHRPGRPEKLP